MVAHRGYRAKYPENTKVAFENAINIGAKMIELDVSLTKDRQVVVIHDDTLERTTNGKGAINCFTLAELKKLDAGSWYDPQFKGERIPTLEEVLDLVKDRTLMNIELKEIYYEEQDSTDTIENQVINLVRKKGMEQAVIISSFEIKYLERLCKKDNLPAMAFISRKPADASVVEACKKLELFSWHPWYEILTQEQVDMMHDAGIKVFSFTVNSKDTFLKLCKMGVDGVFTDDIPLIR